MATESQPQPRFAPPPLEALKPKKAAPKSKSSKLKPMKGVVLSAKKETPDTYTLEIFVGENEREYRAGQFISISPKQFPDLSEMVAYLEDVKGKRELIRAYSLTSAPHEQNIAITVKPERYEAGDTKYPPLLSPLLASDILVGREIEFSGYTGAYVLPVDHAETCDQILHLVAGSGSVPNFAMLKDELLNDKNPTVKHVMINVNKTMEDIIFYQELEDLAARYPKRLKLHHFITRQAGAADLAPNIHEGRPTKEFIAKCITNKERVMAFGCGAGITKWQRQKAREAGSEPSPRFLEAMAQLLLAIGLDKKRFKKEAYG